MTDRKTSYIISGCRGRERKKEREGTEMMDPPGVRLQGNSTCISSVCQEPNGRINANEVSMSHSGIPLLIANTLPYLVGSAGVGRVAIN